MVTGYLSSIYAESLGEFGKPHQLAKSGGWILKRPIGFFSYEDAMGCYPFFNCEDWSRLHLDLKLLSDKLISLAVVTDPFAKFDPANLRNCFPDVFFPYKEHFVADLTESPDTFIDHHHLGCAKKSFKKLQVEICDLQGNCLADWIELYGNLIKKHQVKGILAFSKQAFEKQFQVPGLMAFRARYGKKTVGMILCYVQGENVYCHLGAYNATGYKYMASYAIVLTIIRYCRSEGFKYVNIGSGSGAKANPNDGLSQFKKGWSNCKRITYFCGRIFNAEKYSEIVQARHISETDYFPIYRKGEFR